MSDTIQHRMPVWNQALLSTSKFENWNQKTHTRVLMDHGRESMVDDEAVISNVHYSFVKPTPLLLPCCNDLHIDWIKVYKHQIWT